MATFNGEANVREQICSVLAQLGATDELVIVDDASTDATVRTIRDLEDPRIRLIELPRNLGHVSAFERALTEASGECLMLCDQDDLWPPGRAALLAEALQDSHFVAGNVEPFGARVAPLDHPLRAPMSRWRWRNILGLALGRRAYFGCAMGLRRDLLARLLPFPRHLEAHDHWLAVVANLAGPFPHVEQPVVRRRVHASNLTPRRRRGVWTIARSRLRFVRMVAVAVLRTASTPVATHRERSNPDSGSIRRGFRRCRAAMRQRRSEQ